MVKTYLGAEFWRSSCLNLANGDETLLAVTGTIKAKLKQ